ncbi:MAG TPA: hypothetical protein VE398_08445 [Acidobacteriota bacterium]|nr:hypothetical protein [Acidobacteriota bacterium]
MRCDEIQERFIDLLYSERGTPSASPELQAHIDSCPACRRELAEFRQVQSSLRLWKDEPPLRPVEWQGFRVAVPQRKVYIWAAVRYAAIAAMVLLAFLTIAGPEITWGKQGVTFKTNPPWASRADSYTKAETREIIRAVRDDSENQMNEAMHVMVDQLLDTIDQQRILDLRLVRHQTEQNRIKN